MTKPYTITNVCRVCGFKPLKSVLSLGKQANASNFENKEVIRTPLDLVQCTKCSLLQLKHAVSRKATFANYLYHSGTQEAMVKALQDVVRGTVTRGRSSQHRPIFIDVGCNDGTLLRNVPTEFIRVGFEPSNLYKEAHNPPLIFVYHDFFKKGPVLKDFGKADKITCCACFYDLESPNTFCADIRDVLTSKGIFVIQQNYLLTMLQQNTYDNVSEEHLEFYSLKSLQFLLARHGLEVFDVELNGVNGGSFRTYVCHKDTYAIKQTVSDLEHRESEELTSEELAAFGKRIAEQRTKLVTLLSDLKRQGKVVYGYGASTRGQVILQYCNIDQKLLPAIADRNPEKVGKHTLTGISIISEEQMRKVKPDFLLILPYSYLENFKIREAAFLENGGAFIIPLPEVKVITK